MLTLWSLVFAFAGASVAGGDLYDQARDAEQRARYADAVGFYQACSDGGGPLAPYARVRAAVCRSMAGDAAGGASQLDALIDSPDDGSWKALAAHERARLYTRDGHCAEAATLFGRALHAEADLWWMEDAYWEAAENSIVVPDQQGWGYAYFRKVAGTSLWSKKRYDAAMKLGESPSLDDRLSGVMFLINAGASQEAETLLRSVGAALAERPEYRYVRVRAQARIDMARGRERSGRDNLWALGRDSETGDAGLDALADLTGHLSRRNEFAEAERALAALVERDAAGARSRAARNTLASAYARENRPDDAAAHYSLLAGAGADRGDAESALLAAGHAYRKLGRAREATAYFDQVVEGYPASEAGVEAAYWSGLLMKEAGVGQSEVRKRLRSAATHGLTYYYGHRAVELLAEMGDDDAKKTLRIRLTPSEYVVRPIPMEIDPPQSALEMLRDDERVARLEFFALRGFPEAEWEALAIGNSLKQSPDPAALYLAMGEAGATAYTAMQFANAYGYGEVGDGSQTLTRLRIRYPRAYWNEVAALGREVGVDPYLILAIARQESTYRPGLTSSAGAAGVMQVMPSTARWLARGDPRLAPDLHEDLLDPRGSLRLGAFYLRMMLDRYDGNVIYALAAYNGGPGNCDSWRRNFRGRSQAEFVESIPFTETRNYVKRVLSNYMTYHSIYPPAS